MSLLIYLGLSIHTRTRSEKNIHILHSLGISLSYDCVIKFETLLASAVSKQFIVTKIWYVQEICRKIFIWWEHLTILITTLHQHKDSFHGTAISICQCPTQEKYGDCKEYIVIDPCSSSTYEDYSNVLAVTSVIGERAKRARHLQV